MSTNRHIDQVCCIVLAFVLALTVLFCNARRFGVQAVEQAMGYEDRLFDSSRVHTLDIVMDDWDSFIGGCENEEYELCSLVIDKESYKNVGIRAKGNTSLSMVSGYGNDRYSFKVEFDHYNDGNSYYGLDKLSLNNIIQDNTYMKDFLTYRMMGDFGVNAPLCSYVYITVNGEDWGLYLAVEGVEDSFLERNFGTDYGELYKPDSQSMGGGRGNGGGFRMKDFDGDESAPVAGTEEPDGGMGQAIGNRDMNNKTMGSEDVSLIYSDDEHDSYSNIFENAKTDVSDADKDRLIASLKSLNENSDIQDVVDVEEVIRYFVVHNFVCNFDSYTGSMIHNYYLYEEDGKLSMIPWDYNLAFGGFQSSGEAGNLVNYPIDTPVSGGTVDSRPMLAWIFASQEYTEQYHEYFAEFIADYFDSGYFAELMDDVTELIAPYVESDPTKFCTYEEFEIGADTLREYCLLRAESVSGQLDGTIPSTSEGQSTDSFSLVDASSITISDMGSMDRGGMGGDGFHRESGDMPGVMPDFPEGESGTGESASKEEGTGGEMPGFPGGDRGNGEMSGFPGGDRGNGKMPGFPGSDTEMGSQPDFSDAPEAEAGNRLSSPYLKWIELGVAAAVLLLGLAVVQKVKDRI